MRRRGAAPAEMHCLLPCKHSSGFYTTPSLTFSPQSEEERLLGRQQGAAARGGSRKLDADAGAAPDPMAAGVAVQNGEGDSLGVSSGVLQVPS